MTIFTFHTPPLPLSLDPIAAMAPFALPFESTVLLERRDWFYDALHPSPGNGTISDEIQCYALPFGGLGILSHVLTYYTAILLSLGRKPLPPWSPLKHSPIDTIICLSSMALTVVLTGFTISSCRNAWPFVLLSFWKLTLSFSINAMGLTAAITSNSDKLDPTSSPGKTLVASSLYWIGTICGIVGIFTVVHQTIATNRNVLTLTAVLGGAAGFGLLLAIVSFFFKTSYAFLGVFGLSSIFVFVAVFYSDLVLAAVENNWVGIPSGPSKGSAVVYWTYFAAKRLPMLLQ